MFLKIKGFCVNVTKVFVLTVLALSIASPVFAAGEPKLVSGTVELFKAASGWLLLLVPVGAGCMLGYQAIQKMLTDDHAVISEKNRFMKNVLIGAAIAETASGLVTIILSFYQ